MSAGEPDPPAGRTPIPTASTPLTHVPGYNTLEAQTRRMLNAYHTAMPSMGNLTDSHPSAAALMIPLSRF
jgi:hypothetical protein